MSDQPPARTCHVRAPGSPRICAHCGIAVHWDATRGFWVHVEGFRSCAVALWYHHHDPTELRTPRVNDITYAARPIPYQPDGRAKGRRR